MPLSLVLYLLPANCQCKCLNLDLYLKMAYDEAPYTLTFAIKQIDMRTGDTAIPQYFKSYLAYAHSHSHVKFGRVLERQHATCG